MVFPEIMIPIIAVQFTIIIALIIGCYYDLKYREVSNAISYSILFLCIPLVSVANITLVHIVIAILFTVMTLRGAYGGADLKVLVPIIMSLTTLSLSIFLIGITVFSIPFVIKNKNDIPLFIPITISYMIISYVELL